MAEFDSDRTCSIQHNNNSNLSAVHVCTYTGIVLWKGNNRGNNPSSFFVNFKLDFGTEVFGQE